MENMDTMNAECAAEYLNVAVTTVTTLANDGIIPAAKIGRGYVFLKKNLFAFLNDETAKFQAARKIETQGKDDTKPGRKRNRTPPQLGA